MVEKRAYLMLTLLIEIVDASGDQEIGCVKRKIEAFLNELKEEALKTNRELKKFYDHINNQPEPLDPEVAEAIERDFWDLV